MHTDKTPVGVILVAGVGSRLRPLTDDRPKALIDVGGETLLGRATRLLIAAGVREIVLATGYREDMVRRALEGCPVPVRFCPNPAYDRTQNSVSLHLCRDAIAGRPFFKLDGDLLFEGSVLDRLAAAPDGITAAVEYATGLGAEEMKFTATGARLHSFGKGLDPALSQGESIGLERVSGVAVSRLFHALEQAIEAGETGLYYEDVYARLLTEGVDGWAVDVGAAREGQPRWFEIDTLEDLEAARALLASGALL
jgi:choline kinase